MLNIFSREKLRLCDRISRREAFTIGGLGTMGLALPQLLRSQSQAAPSLSAESDSKSFGSAKRVILLFMWGGPAHQETWDLKPEGPVETRGEFLPISTNVPGIHISEHFPHIARHADKLAIIRSVAQEDNNHSTGAHAGLTGRKHELQAENFGASEKDFPHYGSVLSKIRPNAGGMPTFVALPDVIATTAGVITPGQGAGILGKKYDPFQIIDHPDELNFSVSSLSLPGGLDRSRMLGRRRLLEQVEQVARLSERSRAVHAMDAFYQQALDMVVSPEARRAFDLSAVSEEERWRYGWHTFGQSTLLARRLIEAGVQLVTVYWHRERPTIDSSWDTHALNFQEMRNRLMPSVDRPIAALLEDLEASGLLDETLVIWNSEFGRTPRINGNAGRDHWGPCNSVVMAGGGVPGGQVFGATDKQAAYPTRDPVTQDDIAATVYHLLGLHPETMIHDRLERPFPIALGEPIYKLLDGQSPPDRVPGPAPLPIRPQPGPFYNMLMERGRRFIACDLGREGGEQEWELTGWTEPRGAGIGRHRAVADQAATLKYTGKFHAHFDYGFLAVRFETPASLRGIALSVNGRPIPVPAELQEADPQTLWQIPFPNGLIRSISSFELTIEGDQIAVTDVALVGDPILDHHLAQLLK